MAKNQTPGGRTKHEAYVKLPHYIMDSVAWSQLSVNARCTWAEIVRCYGGLNNGFLGIGARTLADKLHVSKETAARALKELVSLGFVEIAAAGCYANKRRATKYRLTHLPCDKTGAAPSKAFMKIAPHSTCDDTMRRNGHSVIGGADSVTTCPRRPISLPP